MTEFDKLDILEQETDLRSIWPNEAKDFTPWLANNLAYVGNILDMDLELVEMESKVGGYSADILAKDENSEALVVIENQLEDSNHDHLGKLITYASGKKAKAIVWIVKNAREEHRQAIDWLNENTSAEIGFYLLEIELWKIGKSKPALKFNVVESPNEWAKIVKPSPEFSDTKVLQLEYWQAFNDYAKTTSFVKSFKLRAAKPHNWYDLAIGDSRFHICIEAKRQKNEATVGLYIPDDKELYHTILEHQEIWNSALGCSDADCVWAEAKKACRVYLTRVLNFSDTNSWEALFQWYIEKCTVIKKILPKIL